MREEEQVMRTSQSDGRSSFLYCHENNYVFLGDSLLLALIYYSNYTFSLRWHTARHDEVFMFSP